jgi:hypothetical protein
MKRRYCHLCGRPVQSYRQYRRRGVGKAQPALTVCDRCEATQPRCRLCNVPVAEPPAGAGAGTPAGQGTLCPLCRKAQPICLACGAPIVSTYLEVGGVGPFCTTCYQTRPHCDVCGVPVGDTNWILADGRNTCNRCHQTAIYSPERAQQLYERTVDIIQRSLGLSLNVPTGFALVDRNQLRQLVQEMPGRDGLDPDKTLGFFVRRGRQRAMYVEYGLPQILLIQVIAHEFAHAWQGENCPLLRDPLIREGVAEWLAYKVLQALGATKKMEVMEKRSDLYGEGLRHILAIEQAHGVSGVLEYCQSA